MSFVIAAPEFMTAAATDLQSIGATLSAADIAAAGPTTRVLAAGADEVSVAVAALFGGHAQAYQALSAQAAKFHAQFVQALRLRGPMPAPRPPTPRRCKPSSRTPWPR